DLIETVIGSVMSKYGIHAAWVPSDAALCSLALKVFRNAAENKVAKPNKIVTMVKSRDKRVDILKVSFGISEPTALNLLKKFGTVKAIFNASYSQLLDCPGVAEATATKITELTQ